MRFLRNYPISAHLRFLLEEIRPEMRQYFFESEKDGMPFSRDTRRHLSARERWCSTSGPLAPRKMSIATVRMDAPFGGTKLTPTSNFASPSRSGLHQAVFGIGLQYLGDELRRA